MRYLLKSVFGSFFRTLGRILCYLLIGAIISYLIALIKPSIAHASIVELKDFKLPSYAYFYNCTSADNCNSSVTTSWVGENVGGTTEHYYQSNKFTTRADGSGGQVNIYVDEALVKDTYYTISIVLRSDSSALITPVTTNNISVVTSSNNAFYTNASDITTSVRGSLSLCFTESCSVSQNASVVSYSFKSNTNGGYIGFRFTTSATVTSNIELYGYVITTHGFKAPSAEDISNALNSQFSSINNSINNSTNNINNNINNATNDINNNINDMNTDINNNIDDMKNKQDETNNSINSEDEDVSNKKCGIICKLKGIWNGIINLPANIWNLMKGGFEAIGNGLTSLWNGIKDLFTPPQECTTSANLFDFSSMYYSSSSGVVNNDTSVTIPPQGYVQYNLGTPKDFNSSENLWINVEDFCSNCNSTIQAYSIKNGGLWTSLKSSNNTSFPWNLKDTYGTANGRNLIFALRNYTDSNITIEKVMLNYGSSSLPYEQPGEVCTGGGLFDWFGSFFTKIFDGILSIPGLIINGIKALFVPDNMDFLNNLLDTLENKLGLIAQVPVQCIEFILNLANATWTEFNSVSLPSISIFGYNFWNAQEIDLSEGIAIFSSFKYVTDVICVGICVRTLFKWYEGFTGG